MKNWHKRCYDSKKKEKEKRTMEFETILRKDINPHTKMDRKKK
jgi:hypothetical protein